MPTFPAAHARRAQTLGAAVRPGAAQRGRALPQQHRLFQAAALRRASRCGCRMSSALTLKCQARGRQLRWRRNGVGAGPGGGIQLRGGGLGMGAQQTADLAQSALDMALRTRAVREVIFHSERSIQCTALAFTRRCRQAGVLQSMESAGDCFDNAVADTVLATLECELLWCSPFGRRQQTTSEIFRFLEGFYGRRWRHSTPSVRREGPDQPRFCGRTAGLPPSPSDPWLRAPRRLPRHLWVHSDVEHRTLHGHPRLLYRKLDAS